MLDLIEPLLDNGLGNFVVEPSDDAVIPEPITLQSIKVYSPKDPERVVTLLSNGNPDAECRVLTPADVISNISYWLGLAEGIINCSIFNSSSLGSYLSNKSGRRSKVFLKDSFNRHLRIFS